MLFLIHAIDKDDSEADRNNFYDLHKLYLAEVSISDVKIIMSGPLLSHDEKHTVGSLFIIDVVSRSIAEKFHYNDPFYRNGIWKESYIQAFLRRR